MAAAKKKRMAVSARFKAVAPPPKVTMATTSSCIFAISSCMGMCDEFQERVVSALGERGSAQVLRVSVVDMHDVEFDAAEAMLRSFAGWESRDAVTVREEVCDSGLVRFDDSVVRVVDREVVSHAFRYGLRMAASFVETRACDRSTPFVASSRIHTRRKRFSRKNVTVTLSKAVHHAPMHHGAVSLSATAETAALHDPICVRRAVTYANDILQLCLRTRAGYHVPHSATVPDSMVDGSDGNLKSLAGSGCQDGSAGSKTKTTRAGPVVTRTNCM
jgi:hypothetical protein